MALNPSHFIRFSSPIGRIEVRGDESTIGTLTIECAGTLPLDAFDEQTTGVLREAQKQLLQYFDGSRHTFDLPCHTTGTPFQEAVWASLSKLPWGSPLSYGELASSIGKPRAARAVGAAVGANPLPIIVGCHRVLSSNGQLTGYSGGEGIPTKKWLLSHEKIEFTS